MVKKSILQKYMYGMFWILYGTVLLAPFEEVSRSAQEFSKKNSVQRHEELSRLFNMIKEEEARLGLNGKQEGQALRDSERTKVQD